jgi:predicted CXXCH cytochrome family protein
MRYTLALVAVVLVAAPAWAGSISGTAHDLTNGSTGTAISGLTETCKVCHIPHNTLEGATVPLFNHTLTTQTFTGATVGSGTSTEACLSCHDGVTNIDAYGGGTTSPTMTVSGAANLGINLTNDHPVGVPIPGTGPYQSPTNVTLEASNVECGVCHNPHDSTNGNYLEISNAASALCGECHTY